MGVQGAHPSKKMGFQASMAVKQAYSAYVKNNYSIMSFNKKSEVKTEINKKSIKHSVSSVTRCQTPNSVHQGVLGHAHMNQMFIERVHMILNLPLIVQYYPKNVNTLSVYFNRQGCHEPLQVSIKNLILLHFKHKFVKSKPSLGFIASGEKQPYIFKDYYIG